jgi:hypothetical protein
MNQLIRDLFPRYRMKLKDASVLQQSGAMIEGRTRLGKVSLARLIAKKGGHHGR